MILHCDAYLTMTCTAITAGRPGQPVFNCLSFDLLGSRCIDLQTNSKCCEPVITLFC